MPWNISPLFLVGPGTATKRDVDMVSAPTAGQFLRRSVSCLNMSKVNTVAIVSHARAVNAHLSARADARNISSTFIRKSPDISEKLAGRVTRIAQTLWIICRGILVSSEMCAQFARHRLLISTVSKRMFYIFIRTQMCSQ